MEYRHLHFKCWPSRENKRCYRCTVCSGWIHDVCSSNNSDENYVCVYCC